MCRRKYLLYYFGEEFEESKCSSMCDNCSNPREQADCKDEIVLLLDAVAETKEKHKGQHIVNILCGTLTNDVRTYKHDKLECFGKGSERPEKFWNAAIRQSVVGGLLRNDILTASKGGSALDENLLAQLKDLRRTVAKQRNVPPFVVFQDPSLEDMAIQYPVNIQELTQVSGVGQGKADRFGKPFVELIARYVEENEIDRPQDFVMKSVANKSVSKVQIIQNIDRKLSLESIAKAQGKSLLDIIAEIETIVSFGTRVNINYVVDEILDEDNQDEIFDYFKSAETDSIEAAYKEFDGAYNEDELRLMRIKFMSEMAN
jgi:ATP-dependent DNA helicase RecQ